MKILKAGTHGFYDIFAGAGWNNHTRVRYNKKEGRVSFVTGMHLSHKAIQHVVTTIKGESNASIVNNKRLSQLIEEGK